MQSSAESPGSASFLQMIQSPIFVFVPGCHFTYAHFQPLVTALRYLGHQSAACSLPNIGTGASAAASWDDAKAVRTILEELTLTQKRRVILVCHDYGGIVGCQCIKSLDRPSIAQSGGQGGIIGLVFLSALLARDGENAKDLYSACGQDMLPWVEQDPSDRRLLRPNGSAAEYLFNDLDEYSKRKWAAQLQPMSANFQTTQVMSGSWNFRMPKLYLHTTEDQTLWPSSQRLLLERSLDPGWRMISMRSGHAPFLSCVDDTARVLVDFVRNLIED